MDGKQSIGFIKTGQDLLILIERGNKDLFTEFYSVYFKKLLLVSDRYVKSIEVAEEIVQNVFLKIWEEKALLAEIETIKPYLYRSVVNSSINYVNRQKSLERHHLKIAEDLDSQEIEDLDHLNEMIVLLHKEIELLPEKCQIVFRLSRLEGIKYRDIAMQLNISEKTVENHMGNALKILRTKIIKQSSGNIHSQRFKYSYLLTTFLY